MWPICLWHNLMSDSTFCPFANIVVPKSFVLRMNILPYPCWRAIIEPASSMKQPWWLNRTCMLWSTICLTYTKFLVIVSTCKTFLIQPLWPTWRRRTSLICWMGWMVSSSVSTHSDYFGFSMVENHSLCIGLSYYLKLPSWLENLFFLKEYPPLVLKWKWPEAMYKVV